MTTPNYQAQQAQILEQQHQAQQQQLQAAEAAVASHLHMLQDLHQTIVGHIHNHAQNIEPGRPHSMTTTDTDAMPSPDHTRAWIMAYMMEMVSGSSRPRQQQAFEEEDLMALGLKADEIARESAMAEYQLKEIATATAANHATTSLPDLTINAVAAAAEEASGNHNGPSSSRVESDQARLMAANNANHNLPDFIIHPSSSVPGTSA
jgi:hypothetical protein